MKYFKYLAPLFGAAMLLSAALPAQASALTPTQVSAIIQLLQSFGADQSTIANVQVALGGSPTPTRSCSSFADVHYGDFDNDQGGRVSQLQTFLGIPSNTFGFGTYGRKTQAAWDGKCGEQTTKLNISSIFSATPTLGVAPLQVTVTTLFAANFIDFGDGSVAWVGGGPSAYIGSCTISISNSCIYTTTHTYTQAGTYVLKLRSQDQKEITTTAVTVTGSTPQPSATIDQSSLATGSALPTITGTASNIDKVSVVGTNLNPSGNSFYQNDIAVVNGHWSLAITDSLSVGSYIMNVYRSSDLGRFNLLTTGTLTVTGNSIQPSATITSPTTGTSGGTSSGATNLLSASPTAGQVPLAVEFHTTAGPCEGYNSTIAYGDGVMLRLSDFGPQVVSCTGKSPSVPYNWTHFYTSAGSYTATLTSGVSTLGSVSIFATNSPTTVIPSSYTVGPTCTLLTDKTNYAYGGTMVVSWTSTNATYANWVPDTASTPHLELGGGALATSGSQNVVANAPGTPYIIMRIFGPGGYTTCNKTVTITPSQ